MSIARRIARYRLHMNTLTCVLAGVWLGWATWQLNQPAHDPVLHIWVPIKTEAPCCKAPASSSAAREDIHLFAAMSPHSFGDLHANNGTQEVGR
jgi:hypothetical protein